MGGGGDTILCNPQNLQVHNNTQPPFFISENGCMQAGPSHPLLSPSRSNPPPLLGERVPLQRACEVLHRARAAGHAGHLVHQDPGRPAAASQVAQRHPRPQHPPPRCAPNRERWAR